MIFSEALEDRRDQRYVNAHRVQLTTEQIHKHLRVVMGRSHGIQEQHVNKSQLKVQNSQDRSKVWFDTCQVRMTRVVMATVPDCRFGFGSRSEPNHCQIGRPAHQFTQTINLGKIQW